MNREKRFTKKEWSWILYDWANSVYATNIMAAIFPTIFVAFAGAAGDVWWGVGTSISTFAVALLAPVLGAIADYKGMKKKLFTVFMLAGVVFTLLIAVTNNWKIMLLGYILSHIGFSGSCLFYDSFLTDVTTDDRMDKVSAWGYAMGYIGGSTIPFIVSIALLLVLGYSSPIAQKFSVVITSLWWLAFSIPFLKNVEQVHYIERSQGNTVRETLRNIGRTAMDIVRRKGLFLFVLAYFCYIDGVGTIISISTAYGSILGLGAVGMIVALLVMQIVAMPCSILFSKLSAKITARKALCCAVMIYTLICCVGFYMGYSLEPHQMDAKQAVAAFREEYSEPYADLNLSFDDPDGYNAAYAAYLDDCERALLSSDPEAELAKLTLQIENASEHDQAAALLVANEMNAHALDFMQTPATKTALDDYAAAIRFSSVLFWAMAVLVGTVQGGIQATSRSYFGKLIPKERSNEFFGFFDIFGKFAAVIGPLLYSAIATATGRSSYGVLCLAALFLIGLGVLVFGRKELDKLENR